MFKMAGSIFLFLLKRKWSGKNLVLLLVLVLLKSQSVKKEPIVS